MAEQSTLAKAAQVPGAISEEDFHWLYEEYNRPIYGFFANRGCSREECRDLIQETFLAAFRSRGRFRGDSTFETWLFSIAMNVWRSTLRDCKRLKRDAQVISLDLMVEGGQHQEAEDLFEDGSEESRPLEKVLANERTRLVRDALNDLPEQMRCCVVLRLSQDLKYREIAAVMQVSINTVRSQLFDAREKLRDRLAELFKDILL